jgi:hypothetical protein
VKPFAFLADSFQHVQNCFVLATCQAGSGADANAFDKQFDDLHDLFVFNAQTVQRLRFRKGFAAARALEALHDAIDVLEATEFAAFAATAQARCHFLARLSIGLDVTYA